MSVDDVGVGVCDNGGHVDDCVSVGDDGADDNSVMITVACNHITP